MILIFITLFLFLRWFYTVCSPELQVLCPCWPVPYYRPTLGEWWGRPYWCHCIWWQKTRRWVVGVTESKLLYLLQYTT